MTFVVSLWYTIKKALQFHQAISTESGSHSLFSCLDLIGCPACQSHAYLHPSECGRCFGLETAAATWKVVSSSWLLGLRNWSSRVPHPRWAARHANFSCRSVCGVALFHVKTTVNSKLPFVPVAYSGVFLHQKVLVKNDRNDESNL